MGWLLLLILVAMLLATVAAHEHESCSGFGTVKRSHCGLIEDPDVDLCQKMEEESIDYNDCNNTDIDSNRCDQYPDQTMYISDEESHEYDRSMDFAPGSYWLLKNGSCRPLDSQVALLEDDEPSIDSYANYTSTAAWFEFFLPQWGNILKSLRVSDMSRSQEKGTGARSIIHFLVSDDDFHEHLLEDLLQCRADINALDDFDQTPLHLAVSMNRNEVVRVLLRHDAKINCINKAGSSPLHLAILERNEDVICLLLEAEKDQGSFAYEDNQALHLAISREIAPKIIHKLIQAGKAKLSDSPKADWQRIQTAYWRHPRTRPFEDSEQFTLPQPPAIYGITLEHIGPILHHATLECQEETVKLLVDSGIDINAQDPDGNSPLHLAVKYCPSLVHLFVSAGVQLNASNKLGLTALHFAAMDGSRHQVETLVNAGADPIAEDQNGLKPAEYARKAGNKETSKILEEIAYEMHYKTENLESGEIDKEPSIADAENPGPKNSDVNTLTGHNHSSEVMTLDEVNESSSTSRNDPSYNSRSLITDARIFNLYTVFLVFIIF